jgi:hypothetical protein
MITVSILTGDQKPVEQGVALQLVGSGGELIGSAETDASGVASFDLDRADLDQVAVRLAVAQEPAEAAAG